MGLKFRKKYAVVSELLQVELKIVLRNKINVSGSTRQYSGTIAHF